MIKLTKDEKFKIIIDIFNKRDEKILSAYDKELSDKLGLCQKQIERLILEIQAKYHSIETIEASKKTGRRKLYKLIEPTDIFIEMYAQHEELSWLFDMAKNLDHEVFKKLEKYTKNSDDIYLFQNTPFEDISSLESKDIFKKLKRTIKNREYAKIKFFNDDTIYDNLKCLKLVFIDNNWYISYIDQEDILKFGRISFIERVDYATKINVYQESKVEKQVEFLNNNIQNAMTLYGVKNKKAKIKATGFIAKYFEDGMKKFMPSQTFIKKLDDGSIIFTVNYTQDLEILPFVQKWLPDLIILEPQELKDAYIKKLQTTIINQK